MKIKATQRGIVNEEKAGKKKDKQIEIEERKNDRRKEIKEQSNRGKNKVINHKL